MHDDEFHDTQIFIKYS